MAKAKGKASAPYSKPQNMRAQAAQILAQVDAGQSLSALFQTRLDRVAERDQGRLKEICFGVCRYRPRLDALSNLLLQRPIKPKDADIAALLCIGFYQLLYMRTASHAAVAETVDATRALKKPWASGLVNGVLRRLIREEASLLEQLEQDPVARSATPAWLTERLQRAWPEQWESIIRGANQRPPLSLRVNLSRISRQAYAERLTALSMASRPVRDVPSALMLDQAVDVQKLPGFDEGLVSVQDAGAQLAATLLELAPGQTVLDACAAPGGKSGHILESQQGVQLTALDVDRTRLQRVHENLGRLGFGPEVRVCCADAGLSSGDWRETRYDRILLDVPCSATGVIRRHPDIKLLRRDADIAGLTRQQTEILESVWPLLKPGGILLYATCSLLPEENHEQLERFIDRHKEARTPEIAASWGHACPIGRQTLPGESGMDGFYYALLEKPL